MIVVDSISCDPQWLIWTSFYIIITALYLLLNNFNSPGQWMWIFKLTPHYRWTSQTLWVREIRSSSPSTPRYSTSVYKISQDCVFVISALPSKSAWPYAHVVYCIHSLNDYLFIFFQSTLPNFKQNEFSVVRQHEEFIWLHDSFVENEEYAGYIVSTVECFAYCNTCLISDVRDHSHRNVILSFAFHWTLVWTVWFILAFKHYFIICVWEQTFHPLLPSLKSLLVLL